MLLDFLHIEWTTTNQMRMISACILLVVAFEMVLILAAYWHTVMPLRKEIADGKVVAPPERWTFAYHLSVLAFVLVAAVIRVQLAMTSAPTNIGTYALPVIGVALAFTSSKFLTYYIRRLREEDRRRHGLRRGDEEGPDLSGSRT